MPLNLLVSKQNPFKASWLKIIKRSFGQPVYQTHPHIMNEDEVTPGITKVEYHMRRASLWQSLSSQDTNIVAVIPSSSTSYMAFEVPYSFRQNTDFSYLSGFQEPDSILLMTNLNCKNKSDFTSMLFVPRRDKKRELWDGPRTGSERASGLTGVDESYNINDFSGVIKSLTTNQGPYSLYYNYRNPSNQHFHHSLMESICDEASKVVSVTKFIQTIRQIKSASEKRLLRRAASIASHAITKLMAFSKPDIEEAHIEALMDFECKINGATRLAYPPVIAGGDRANIIHYIENNQRVNDGEVILVDAGCEYHGYSSDITRSWPVNGTYSPQQRDLYEALLEVQKQCIRLCIPNTLSLNQIHVVMVQLLSKQLVRLGIISPSASDADVRQLTLELCPHHVGHYLGMDVHDVDELSRNTPLSPGTLVTIEPGLYVNNNNTNVSKKWRGIGMRIEDDVLITEGENPEVLSSECPKEIEHIEDIVRSGYSDV